MLSFAIQRPGAVLIAAFLCAHLRLISPLLAQTGLDSLNDDAVMNELATRGMTDLLERAFELNKVPPAQRDARRAMLALRQLADGSRNLTPQQRQELIDRATRGIDAALPGLTDPEAMMQQARTLIDLAADRNVNMLELWGPNTAVQAALRPVAETVVRLYDRAAERARAAVDSLGNQPNVDEKRIDRAYQLAQLAEYNARMSDYLLAIAIDPADRRRAEIADRSIKYLNDLDTPDQPIRVAIRLRVGKLLMLKGDYEGARQKLATILSDPQLNATALEQYQARYFLAAVEVEAQRPEVAQKSLDALIAWQEANLPSDPATRQSATAAAAMLQYRIHDLQARLARAPADRQRASQAAVETLQRLLKVRPDLQAAISELLMARLPADAPLKDMDVLLLQSLVSRAEQERLRGGSPDAATIRRGIAAAREILTRPDPDPQLADNCRFVIPFLLQTVGEQLAAAGEFLDYAQRAGPGERGDIALGNAQSVIARLRRDNMEDEQVRSLYERFLPIAIDQFGRREFAFEYARRLQVLGKPADAAKYFRLVPDGDARSLQAKFFLMLAHKQELDSLPLGNASRGQLQKEIQALADVVNQRAAESLDTAKSPDERRNLNSMLVRTKMLAAELARTEQKDPSRAISILSDIEPRLAALEGGEALLPEVLLIRVQSFMAMGQSDDATAALLQLLSKREGGQGAAIVYNLLEKLNHELDLARAAGDSARMAVVARNRAELSGFLVKWARDNPDAGIRKFTYRYMVFDAASKHLAADLMTDPAAQQSAWREALSLYRALESAENFKLYQATLDSRAAATAAYDPAVSFGIALLCYDLREFDEARDRLARLLNDRKLGTPIITIEENGVQRETDNEQYWEGVLKFLRASLVTGKNIDQCKAYLKEQDIRWGDHVGGKRWKAEFAKLREELK